MSKFKVGDLVYFVSSVNGKNKYCIINEIIGNEIWGIWYWNKKDCIKYIIDNTNDGFMHESDCYLIKPTKINYRELITKRLKEY